MTAERRELAADRLAWRVWQCIEEAGETNRAKRGLKTDRGDSKPAGAEGPGADPANQGPAAPTSANLDESRKTSRHSQGTHAGEAGSNRSSAAASGSIDRVVPQVGLDKGSAQNHAQHEGS